MKDRAVVRMGRLACVHCKAALARPGVRCRTCGWAQDHNPDGSQRNREVALLLTLALVAVATGFAVFFELLLAQ